VSSRAGLVAVVKGKIPNSCWELNPVRPARSLVAILNELPRLLRSELPIGLRSTFVLVFYNVNCSAD
jgi:hypothetical protein